MPRTADLLIANEAPTRPPDQGGPAKVEPPVEKQAQQKFQNQLDRDVVEEKIEENKKEIHADAEKAEEKEVENDNQISN